MQSKTVNNIILALLRGSIPQPESMILVENVDSGLLKRVGFMKMTEIVTSG